MPETDKPEKEAFTVRIEKSVYEDLRKLVYEQRSSFQALTEQAIERMLERQGRREPLLATVSKDERKTLEAATLLLRDGPADLRDIFLALVEHAGKVRKG